ncbi:hypothetical protein Naga_100766g2 [Nannochloropsis gaditana]|uniref:Uncharacterized protein n=1 Tax=Nannochloropsis gaditana TaxID=72520 RepID=W7TAY7_9STRA|nr:hypothetical protein Naga_100766g2 [Nannochloropsis gaditana]
MVFPQYIRQLETTPSLEPLRNPFSLALASSTQMPNNAVYVMENPSHHGLHMKRGHKVCMSATITPYVCIKVKYQEELKQRGAPIQRATS